MTPKLMLAALGSEWKQEGEGHHFVNGNLRLHRTVGVDENNKGWVVKRNWYDQEVAWPCRTEGAVLEVAIALSLAEALSEKEV